MPKIHSHWFRRSTLPIDLQFCAALIRVEKSCLVLAIEKAAAAVLRGAVESAHKLAARFPNADASGRLVVFRHPDRSIARDSDARGEMHLLRIVRPNWRLASDAHGPKEFSVR